MLATFAATPAGKLYHRTCERYGVDPAAGFADDVLAHNFRVILALNDRDEEREERDGR